MRVLELGPGARAAITDRAGGVSDAPFDGLNLSYRVGDDPAHVAENRRRAAATAGLDPSRVVWMEQVHGAEVAVVHDPAVSPVAGVDALVTTERGLALGVLVADCLPVLLADTDAGVVGAAHAGRRGLAGGIVGATVAAMRSLGAEPAGLQALIGPGIRSCCYEVGADVRDDVVERVPETSARTAEGGPALDLAAGVLAELGRAGVRRHSRVAVCTAEDPAYFSYRRDGVTGRFAGYIRLA